MGKIIIGLNFEVSVYCFFYSIGKTRVYESSKGLLFINRQLLIYTRIMDSNLIMFTVVVSNYRLLLKDSNIECLRSHWLIFKEMRIMHSGRYG